MVEFAYAVGRLRALEAQLLDESKILRLVDSADFESAYLVLREIPHYAEKIDRLEHPFDFEALLDLELESVKNLLEYLAPENELLRVMWKKYEPDISLSNYLKLLNQTAKKHPVPLFLKYVQGFTILNQLKLDLLGGKIDLEATQNKYRYTDYHQALSIGLEHYKKTRSLFVLEKEIDNHLMRIVQKAKYRTFGIEPLLGYAFAKEIEMKIIRLILVAKKMQVKTELIKERLRLPYV